MGCDDDVMCPDFVESFRSFCGANSQGENVIM